MNAPAHLQDLVAEVSRTHPISKIDFEVLPSGVCLLYVYYGRREFMLDYSPTRGTGVSENFENTPPFIGHDVAFSSLDQAVAHFKSLLTDAARTEAEHLPKPLVLNETMPH